jgi:hypothetical protein
MRNYVTIEDLRDKNTPALSHLFSLSFEYLLAGIAKEYNEILNVKGQYLSNVKAFNEANTLHPTLLLSYPFFVSLANGHSKALYNLFGPFYAINYGPVSSSIFNLLKEPNEQTQLKYFDVNPNKPRVVGIELLNAEQYKTLSLSLTFSAIQKQIRDEIVQVDGENARYADVYIVRDNANIIENNPSYADVSPLSKAIDNGIAAIVEQSEGTFFDADSNSILSQSRYFRAYKENQNAIIPYEQIESPAYRPFYAENIS